MVIALLNQKGGVGKTTLSVHLAAALAEKDKVLLVDADPQESALDWAAKHEEGGSRPPFAVVALPSKKLHTQVALMSPDYRWIVIDGPPRVNDITRSAIVASGLVIIPVQPSPYDIWACEEVEDIISECGVSNPGILVRYLLNRLFANTTLARDVEEELGKRPFPAFRAAISNRTEFARSACSGMTALETEPNGPAAVEIRQWVREIKVTLKKGIDNAIRQAS